MKKSSILYSGRALFVALLGLAFTACCACRQGSPKLANSEVDDWQLSEFQAEAVEPAQAVTLSFDPEKKMLYGKAPCNNFFSSYTLLDSKKENIQFGVGGATRKFCPNAQVEDAFVRALPSVVRLQIEGDKLLMLNAEWELVALLAAAPKRAE